MHSLPLSPGKSSTFQRKAPTSKNTNHITLVTIDMRISSQSVGIKTILKKLVTPQSSHGETTPLHNPQTQSRELLF